MKVKLFTHTDLDGVGCAILGKLSFSEENIDIEYCNYDDINEKVEKFFFSEDNYSQYDKVFITDISVTDGLANKITKSFYTKNIQLLDHHPTALELNNYSWCKVIIENEKGKLSGTKLFYDYIYNEVPHKTRLFKQNIKDFVEVIRQYDTWEWKTKYNNEEPKQWNDLLYIIGRDEFVKQMIDKLKTHDIFEFSDSELKLLKIEENRKQNYIDKKLKEITREIIVVDNKTYSMGVVFAEQYISELGNTLAINNPDLDFIAIIDNCKTISYRGVKDNIDLGKNIASIFGGGGHPKAAGSQINNNIKDKIIELIFDKIFINKINKTVDNKI